MEGGIDVVVKEAMNAEAIITSGLSTTSNGELLETGGMFYISAYSNGKELKINPNKPVHAQVPTDEIKPGMMLFSGEKLPNGQINWVNPKELEKYLVPVEITSLNFYPPNYENKLSELGYGEKSKKWKDSLYYSFAEKTEYEDSIVRTDSMISYYSVPKKTNHTNLINPAKIQTIWNAKFNNTLLATKEFEERLKVIFSTCDNSLLELHINNIEKNMYEIDDMAFAKSGNAKFKEFAERKDGKVKVNEAFAKNLSKYYEQQSKKNQEAITALRDKFYKKQNELNQQFNKAQNEHAEKEAEIANNNFDKEFTKNLNETYKQLGINI
ncbi:MAG: OmpH family outer membrane protein, partial [Flavobacteriales bacterium]